MRKLISILLLTTLLSSVFAEDKKSTETYDATQIVTMMKFGWNLGNTLDALGGSWKKGLNTQTAWGQPLTTKEMKTASVFENAGWMEDVTIKDTEGNDVAYTSPWRLYNGYYPSFSPKAKCDEGYKNFVWDGNNGCVCENGYVTLGSSCGIVTDYTEVCDEN